ncbi:MAG: hypoxanthine phosphoribosyltransferase [Actinomycetota bacterium]|nr:hypoxanthine phosphoribosyltransferase [Actinomycetota bacterium]
MAIAQILFDSQTIQQRVRELAAEVVSKLEDERPLLVAVLKGSVMFLADLVREMGIDADIEFMSISAYPGSSPGTPRTGVVRIVKDLEQPLEHRDVIVVEDIVDTGLTLSFLLKNLEAREPKNLRVCTLVNKDVRRIAEPSIDHVGFHTGQFVVGYGLDFKGRYRNLPFIAGVSDVAALAARPDSLLNLFADMTIPEAGSTATGSSNPGSASR